MLYLNMVLYICAIPKFNLELGSSSCQLHIDAQLSKMKAIYLLIAMSLGFELIIGLPFNETKVENSNFVLENDKKEAKSTRGSTTKT